MRIAIPVDEKTINGDVCVSFGRAPYFLIYDTKTNEEIYLDNSAVASQGGAGVKAAQVVADNGVKALLTPRIGENAEKVLRNAEVLVYKTISNSIKENIDAFILEKLVLLYDVHPGFHQHS
jgi:predicted Fe-Mo cluster-binding NifX family protein